MKTLEKQTRVKLIFPVVIFVVCKLQVRGHVSAHRYREHQGDTYPKGACKKTPR